MNTPTIKQLKIMINQQQTQTMTTQPTDITTDEKIQQLTYLIESIGVCMFTTRDEAGHLVSRAMYPRKIRDHSVKIFYFFSNSHSCKDVELENNADVNLAFISPATREWISISGQARHVLDKELKRTLWGTDIVEWIGDLKDGIHDGSVNDPRLALIAVTASSIRFSVKEDIQIVRMFNVVKGIVTGEAPKLTPDKQLSPQELASISKLE